MKKDPITQPVRLLVTHQNPDLDAIGAVWLFMRNGGRNFDGVEYYFVSAGNEIDAETLQAKGLHKNQVVHVDTGLGPFDHHQLDNTKRDSATLRVYDYLIQKHKELAENQALKRVVMFINDTDHFSSYWWPDPTEDRYMFMLEEILGGLRNIRQFSDRELLELGMVCLDGVYASMRMRVSAEQDVEEKGWEFESPWGKALAMENKNDDVIKFAQKLGYDLVIRKDEERGHIRVKAAPDKGIDLTQLYEAILAKDAEGTWYLHPSRAMLLNGSRKHSGQVASSLSLEEVVDLARQE